MYINPFWAGVAAKILFDVVALIVAAVVLCKRK